MESKLEKILAIVCGLCKKDSGGRCCDDGDIPECTLRDRVAAILASPEVVVVEGIEWVTQDTCEYQHLKNDVLYLVRKDHNHGHWVVVEQDHGIGAFSDRDSALSAATAAIKETN